MGENYNRREFVLGSGALAAGWIWAGKQPAKAADILNYNPKMNYRTLGKTNLIVSEVSLGGHWRNKVGGRFWDGNDYMPDDATENRIDVISHAIEVGMNYVDLTTAAEAVAYGRALKGRREKMYVGYSDHILCMRNAANRNPTAVMREIDEGLRRLQTDYIDIFREQAAETHTDAEIEMWLDTVQKAMKQGKVRHIGLSCHNRDFHKYLMDNYPEFEMLIMPFQGFSEVAEEDSVFPLGKEKNVGIATIKPFSGGSLFDNHRLSAYDAKPGDGYDLARLAVRQILSNEYLSCMLPGVTTIREMDNVIRAMSEPRELNEEEKKFLNDEGTQTRASLPPDYRWLRGWVKV